MVFETASAFVMQDRTKFRLAQGTVYLQDNISGGIADKKMASCVLPPWFSPLPFLHEALQGSSSVGGLSRPAQRHDQRRQHRALPT